MITIEIKINANTLFFVQTHRMEEFKSNNRVYTYLVEGSGGKKIRHNYKDGAIKLAIKILKVLDKL